MLISLDNFKASTELVEKLEDVRETLGNVRRVHASRATVRVHIADLPTHDRDGLSGEAILIESLVPLAIATAVDSLHAQERDLVAKLAALGVAA